MPGELEEIGEAAEDLKPYNVRLPRELCHQIAVARILRGKKAQDLVRDALREYLARLKI